MLHQVSLWPKISKLTQWSDPLSKSTYKNVPTYTAGRYTKCQVHNYV